MKWKLSKKLTPGRMIALGFLSVILLGAVLLMIPVARNDGQMGNFVDSLFTSTSAVCVTGLVVMDTAGTFTLFGRTVMAILIQIGGLGVATLGVSVMVLAGKRVGLKNRVLIKESWNLSSVHGILALLKSVLVVTLVIEGIGMVLSFLVFVKTYAPLDALGMSAFHSIAAFNNSGFDLLGGFNSMVGYRADVLLNLVTCALIILGGLGFFVMRDMWIKRSFRKLTLQSKVVLTTTIFFLIAGTLLLKLSDGAMTWLEAFFQSTSARTAGFATYPMGLMSNAGLIVMCVLMFIGASPGSTGGGIKTTTIFTLAHIFRSATTHRDCSAYKRKVPQVVIFRAFTITMMAVMVIFLGVFLICLFQPGCTFMEVFFEVVSAFGTVGLSTGITPDLCTGSKFVLMVIMFIGRLGPLTIASLWTAKLASNVSYSEEELMVG